MILPWIKRRNGRNRKATIATADDAIELTIPTHFRCPISLDLMKDPVTLSTGITYDRDCIEAWIYEQGHNTCPVTKQFLPALEPVPNHAIRMMIQDWCVENQSYGVDRIPTPRIPLSSSEVSDLLAKLESSTAEIANSIAAKIAEKVRESDRNRQVVLAHGGARVIAAKFESFSTTGDENGVVLEELLACLAMFAHALDEGTRSHVGSINSVKRIVSILNSGDLASKRNAIIVMKEIVGSRADVLAETKGALDGLVNAVKEPVSPASLKNSLLVIYHIMKNGSGSGPVTEFLDLGLLPEVVEIAISSEKSTCEKALGVLDELCGEARGREAVRGHATAVPVVVKKMLRVSDLATEFAVSILWKLCGDDRRREVLKEALEVGAFQKLLLVLQVGCVNEVGGTKEKVTELLKMLNGFQRETGRLECVESMDFKDLKRSF